MKRRVGCGKAQRRPTISLVPMLRVGTHWMDALRPRIGYEAAERPISAYPRRAWAQERKRQSGAALIMVLIGMAVATTIFLSVLKLIAVQRQSVELQSRQIQAGWLAESAVQRACARLSAEGNYHGETWNISAQDIGGRDGATIAIRVDEVAGKPQRRAVHVEADYPDDPFQRARQAREVIVVLKGPQP
ncbi:MAG: hypothetical protein ACLP9L_33575 [Thermoguttaceae bacterium]